MQLGILPNPDKSFITVHKYLPVPYLDVKLALNKTFVLT